LEATTGWRFVVEELGRVGAEVHLAEPAEAAALKGKKKRAKTDCADARLLRELLLIGRLPESWIPPAHRRRICRTLRTLRNTKRASRAGTARGRTTVRSTEARTAAMLASARTATMMRRAITSEIRGGLPVDRRQGEFTNRAPAGTKRRPTPLGSPRLRPNRKRRPRVLESPKAA
jgi:hypothetical protein